MGGFHEGELAVQRRAGVEAEAARLAGMLERGDLRGGVARFLADRSFAAVTARDASGRLWVSPLVGPPGFLDVTGAATLTVGSAPAEGDPLHRLPSGQPVGLIVVDFATRRRVRINGILTACSSRTLRLEVEQAYGNCPQYIQRRTLVPVGASAAGSAATVRRGAPLTEADIAVIERADTLLVGTVHPTRGADASHRGGPSGFVRVEGNRLWWPDYRGNSMFNTLGNLAVAPEAAILVPDFRTGTTIQLSGTARTDWTAPGATGDDGGTGRRVSFVVEDLVAGQLLPVRADDVDPYVHNPPLTT